MKTKIFIFCCALPLLWLAFGSPDRILTGTVTSPDGDPLIGAKVVIDRTTAHTSTDYEGQFSIEAPVDAFNLTITYVGFEKKTISIAPGQKTIDVVLIKKPAPLPERLISGQISDTEGTPLVGASIWITGTRLGTVSDVDGSFKLSIPDKEEVTIDVSYTGYQPTSLTVSPTTSHVTAKLEEGAGLDEVVVAGYDIAHSEKRIKYTTSKIAPAASPPPPPPPAKSLSTYDAATTKTADLSEAYIAPLEAEAPEFVDFAVDDMSKEEAFMRGMPGSAGTSMRAGQLTAGEVNDFMKWELWKDISEEDLLIHQQAWQILPKERYMVQLQSTTGQSLPDGIVQLISTEGYVIWETRTDNTGKAELWTNLFYGQQDVVSHIIVQHGGQEKRLDTPKAYQEQINIIQLAAECDIPKAVDIVFAVDATGSMQDEINYLKAELNDVIDRIKDTLPDIELRMGSVFYRDKTDAYLTRHTPLSADISKTTNFIKEQNAGGGGDRPEAVEDALEVAINNMEWSENAVARIVFLVLDAPPHNNPEVQGYLRQLTQIAAKKGVRIVPVACSGTDKPMEYLMRSISLATNGSYIFLTDDSGIGLSHIEPTTDDYKVEKLNDLLQRVIYQFAFTPPCDEELRFPIDPLVPDTAVVAKNLQPKEEAASPGAITWKYYPNPSSGQITVEIEGPVEHLFLTDLSGKVLQRFLVNGSNRLEIDLSMYPDGIYNLRYEYQRDRWMNGKVILARA